MLLTVWKYLAFERFFFIFKHYVKYMKLNPTTKINEKTLHQWGLTLIWMAWKHSKPNIYTSFKVLWFDPYQNIEKKECLHYMS